MNEKISLQNVKKIKFSIITVCYNSGAVIGRAIRSVIKQTYIDIEYIIIDNQSTDNTLNVIDEYREKISKVVSEPDSGIFNAMNKGIKFANGDYLFFLNADDCLLDENTIWNVANIINDFPDQDIDVFHGGVLMYNPKEGSGNIWRSGPITKYSIYRGAIPHPATFYSKKAFEKNGVFDDSYKITGDYEWIVRGFIRTGLKFKYINIITVLFSKGGVSTNLECDQIHKSERKKIAISYFGKIEEKIFRLRKRLRKVF